MLRCFIVQLTEKGIDESLVETISSDCGMFLLVSFIASREKRERWTAPGNFTGQARSAARSVTHEASQRSVRSPVTSAAVSRAFSQFYPVELRWQFSFQPETSNAPLVGFSSFLFLFFQFFFFNSTIFVIFDHPGCLQSQVIFKLNFIIFKKIPKLRKII